MSYASAQPVLPGDLDLQRERQERLLREQERRIEELRQLPATAAQPAEPAPAPERCFEIRRIELTGASLPDQAERQELLAPFVGRCLAAGDLNALLKRITDWYLDRGYVTSRAYLPEQDLGSGRLEIIVIEGRLEGIEAKPDSGLTERELNMAFPGKTGEFLNLRELEQLTDQLNRLPSNRAAVELLLGEAPGGSRAVIANQPAKPWRVSFTRHNDGQRSTGEQQWNLGLELDSPLGLADHLIVRGGSSTQRTQERAADNGFLAYSLPLGWWTFSYSYSQSRYRTVNEFFGLQFAASGNSRSHELRAERLLHRDAQGKTAVNFALGQVASRNYIEGSLLESSSPRLSEAALAFNHGRRIGSAFVNLDLGWQRGVDLFGGRVDRHPDSDAPHAQYDKYTLTGSFLQPFALAGQSFSFDSMLYFQKSEDVLYSARRVSIGGLGSVRGFKEGSLSGDSGGYLRNQLRWRSAIPAHALGAAAADWLPELAGEFGLALAWDVGVISRDRHNAFTGQHGRISGRAIELSTRGRKARLSLTWAESLSRPAALLKRERPLHFRLEILL